MKTKRKHTIMIAMLAKIASIMLVLGMVASAVAYAGPTQEPNAEHQNEQEIRQTSGERLYEAQQSYQDSKERFQLANKQFAAVRNSENTEKLKIALRDHLNNTIYYTVKRLEALQVRAEEAETNEFAPFTISDNIEVYINQLEELEDDVAAAETTEDFQKVIREIKRIWEQVHLESRYFIMGTLNNKVGVFQERSNSIAIRIQAEIDRLDEAGEDTRELKELLDDYEKALDDAEVSNEDATELFDNHNGFNNDGELQNAEVARAFMTEAAAKMRESHQNLRNVNSVLKQIFQELKEHRPGSVNLRGTGALRAEGNGKATLSGNLEIKINANHGILTITDYEEDAVIEIEGEGTKEVLDNGTIRYKGFNGSATIKGSSITVVITGENIEMDAEGTGSAVLRGYGSYNVDGREGKEWAHQVQTTSQIQSQTQTEQGNQTQSQPQTKTKDPKKSSGGSTDAN